MKSTARVLPSLIIVCLICGFGMVSMAVAQTGTVSGVVTSDQTGKPLAGANIIVAGTDLRTATDADGRFIIETVPAGPVMLQISRVGFETVTRDLNITESESVQLSVGLAVKPVLLDDVIVNRTSLVGNRERLFKTPGSAHYISASEMERFEYNDINQSLRDIPGVNIQEEDGYGLRPNIGFRGSGAERSQKITIMEDGVLIAPAPYSAPAAYYFPTVGRMSGIEVRKGSSQIKFGPFTTAGALNMLSTPIPPEFRGQVEFLSGENNARRIHATAGESAPHFGFVAETFQDRVDGFKNLDGGGPTGYDIKDYMVKLRLNTATDATVYQQVEFKYSQTDEISNETYLGLTDADFAETPYRRYAGSQKDVMDADHEQFQVRHFAKPSDRFDVTTTFYRNVFTRNWYKLDRVRGSEDGSNVSIGSILADPETYAAEYAVIAGDAGSHANALTVKSNNRQYYSMGLQSVAGFDLGRHSVEAGIRYHEDEMDRFQWNDEYRMTDGVMMLTLAGTPGTESNRIAQAQAWAAFAEARLSFDKLTVVPGLRFETMNLSQDDYGKSDPGRTGSDLSSRENDVDVLIPGVGIDYRFSEAVSGFSGVHKGFAPPGSTPGTEPEESINYEAGLRYRDDALTAQTVVYFNNYTNLLGADLAAGGGTGSGDLFNGGDVDVKGLELSAAYDIASHLDTPAGLSVPVSVAYSFTDANFQNAFESSFGPWGTVEEGDELPYVARHQLSLGADVAKERFRISANGTYKGKMRTKAGQGSYDDTEATDAHLVLDLAGEYSVTSLVKVFGGIRNVLDETYIAARRPAGVRPGLPRTLTIGLKTGF